MSIIYLIRHGQASFMKDDYDELSQLGVSQAKTLGLTLKNRKSQVSIVQSGTMIRHQETATNCLTSFGKCPDRITDQRWDEYDHMELMARYNPNFSTFDKIRDHIKDQENPMRALQEVLNQSITDWIANKEEYSVSWPNFKEASWIALNEIADKLEKGQNAWIFTSGGPVSAIVMRLLSLQDEQFANLQGRLVNSSITKVLVGKNRLSLSTYNDYSHLEHEPDWVTYR